jgi:endonuclease YncB( thermonuclease family)
MFDEIPYALVVPDYTYYAYVHHWVDGDTVDLDIVVKLDFGFHHYSTDLWKLRMRLNGLDTPENGQVNHDEATAFSEAHAPVGSLLRAKMTKMPTSYANTEKYGRYLVELFANGEDVNDALIASGLAKKYDGGKKS